MFRIITGVTMTIFGLGTLYIGWRIGGPPAIIGLIAVGAGIAILLNKGEDDIEQISK